LLQEGNDASTSEGGLTRRREGRWTTVHGWLFGRML